MLEWNYITEINKNSENVSTEIEVNKINPCGHTLTQNFETFLRRGILTTLSHLSQERNIIVSKIHFWIIC
jgi:hypothetical protein